MLAELWVRALAIYGHRWESQYGRTPAGLTGETWAAGLADLSPAEIGKGLDVCLLGSEAWPPSLPEFRAMCFGVPSFAAVRLDLQKDSPDRMPFTRLTWEHLDGYAYRQADAARADRMLRDAYALAREHVVAGGALPDKVTRLIERAPTDKPKPADPETAKRYMAEIAAILSGEEPAHAA